MPTSAKPRKRMVVEEVAAADENTTQTAPEPVSNAVSETAQHENVSSPVSLAESAANLSKEEDSSAMDKMADTTAAAQTAAEGISTESVAPESQTSNETVSITPEPAVAEAPVAAEPINMQETTSEAPSVDTQNDHPEPTPVLINSATSTNPLVIIIPGIFLLGALLGGIYFYQKGMTNSSDLNSSPTPMANQAESPAPLASASPSAVIDLSKYPVNILNGSGIAGEAGKVKTLLTGAGFSVSATGNASSYNFTKTIIKAKADVPGEFITKLSDALKKNYLLDANQTLATSSADKVQIIVGSSKP